MKFYIKNQSLYLLLIVFVLLAQSVLADDTAFQRVQLSYGISIEIPSHWEVLSQDAKQNLAAASESMERNAGVVDDSGKKDRLYWLSVRPPFHLEQKFASALQRHLNTHKIICPQLLLQS